jgi:hypothetical protein
MCWSFDLTMRSDVNEDRSKKTMISEVEFYVCISSLCIAIYNKTQTKSKTSWSQTSNSGCINIDRFIIFQLDIHIHKFWSTNTYIHFQKGVGRNLECWLYHHQ